MNPRDKQIARVRALLDKNVENGASEAEALSALNKANELMKSWLILEHEINDPYIGEKCILKEIPLIKSGYDLGFMYNELARLFDCEYFYNKHKISFFGFIEDVELCCYFYNLITKSCLLEKDKYLKSPEGIIAKKYHNGRTISASFIKGFLIKIAVKMDDLYKDKTSNLPPQTGLMVLAKKDKVDDQFLAFDFKIKTNKARELVIEQKAFQSGINKGAEFKLTQGIDDHKKENALQIQ